MSNVKTFISNGGRATWEYLVFKHNQHQTSQAEALSKRMGFENFRHFFSERWQDFDAHGNYRDIKKLKVDDYIIEKPEDQPEDFVAEGEGHNLAKNVFTKPKIDDFFTKKIYFLIVILFGAKILKTYGITFQLLILRLLVL